MKIDKKTICNLVRSNYPKTFGIRKKMQRLKVKRLKYHLIPKQEVKICEQYPENKSEIITPYLKKWNKKLKSSVDEMNDIIENAELYRCRNDIDKIKTDMMFCRLAYGFLPSEYITFELENKSPKERKKFVSDVETKVFGYSVNDITEMQSIIDKGKSFVKFQKLFNRDGVVIKTKSDYTRYCQFISTHPVFVKKSVLSSMGKGVELVDIRNTGMTRLNYFNKLLSEGSYLLEEIVEQCSEMAYLNTSSVNTIRCITLNVNGKIVVPWCFLRTGRNGSFVDNGGSGGLVIGVDSVKGIVNSDGFDEYNNAFVKHPDTNVVFKGFQIPQWDEMLLFCKKAAKRIRGVNYLSWDMALTDNGWTVIEINEVGQLIGPQMTMKKGIKKELYNYIRLMNKFV